MAGDAFDLAEQIADAGVRHVGSRPRHEQLDVGAVRVSREAAESRQGADQGRPRPGWAASRATRTWTATAFGYRTLPGTEHPARRGLRAAAATTRKAQYSERPDDYANNMDRLARKFETARTLVPRPRWCATMATRSASSPTAPRIMRPVETLDQLQSEYGRQRRLPAAARLSVHARDARVHRRASSASTSSTRTATGRCMELLKLDIAVPEIAQAAQRAPLQRAADRRALHHRRHHFAGGQVMATTPTAPPAAEDEPHRPDRARLSRRQDHAVRRLRPQRDLRAHHRRVLRDGHCSPSASSRCRASAARRRARPTS